MFARLLVITVVLINWEVSRRYLQPSVRRATLDTRWPFGVSAT
jgi:hypothetical protein